MTDPRALRRASIGNLLARAERVALTPADAGLLRQHIDTELDDAGQLAATILRIQTLTETHPVTIPTHLVEEALDTTSPTTTEHVYLSTGCWHGDHAYCQAMTGLNGAKRPAECKKCGVHCICECHSEATTEGGPNA